MESEEVSEETLGDKLLRQSIEHRAFAKDREKVWFRRTFVFLIPGIVIGVAGLAVEASWLIMISVVIFSAGAVCAVIMGLWALTSETA